jgi:hypothetical protein
VSATGWGNLTKRQKSMIGILLISTLLTLKVTATNPRPTSATTSSVDQGTLPPTTILTDNATTTSVANSIPPVTAPITTFPQRPTLAHWLLHNSFAADSEARACLFDSLIFVNPDAISIISSPHFDWSGFDNTCGILGIGSYQFVTSWNQLAQDIFQLEPPDSNMEGDLATVLSDLRHLRDLYN